MLKIFFADHGRGPTPSAVAHIREWAASATP